MSIEYITKAEPAENNYAGKVNFNTKIFSDFMVSESFKSLRTNLLFCTNNCKTILVTSYNQDNGKSTISSGISMSLAEINKKTLLIDADMRNSTMFENKNISGTVKGLSEYLSGQAELQQILYSTQIDNFDVMFSGKFPPNPVELLSDHMFGELLENLKNIYDYIIIDTPPIGLVTDAAVIGSVCDGSIIVISSGKTRIFEASYVKDQLEKSKCKILGAVINQKVSLIKFGSKYSYKKDYGYYSKQYGGYIKKKRKKKEKEKEKEKS